MEQITVEVTADPTACANPNSIPINSTLQFEALVTGASQNVIWQVQHVTGGNSTLGTITPDGLYTAPAQLPNPTMVVISAISVDDPQVSGNLPITISLTAATAVIVSPSKASVAVTLGLDLKATVLGGLTDSTVNWLVNGIPGGDAGTVGVVQNPQRDQSTCSTTVQYLAPATVPAPPLPNPVPIIAVAVDNTESAPSMVTITAQAQFTLQLSPSGQVNLMVGQTQKYNAQELADLNDSVTWSVSGKSCSGLACGTITPATSAPPQPYVATYTAPLIVPSPDNTVTVTVSSIHHPGVSASDVISLSTGVPSISIEPTSQTVPVGQNQVPFKATISNYDPAASVTWEVQCISDWDGDPGEDCNDTERGGNGDGPGCIQAQGGQQHCGQAQPLTVDGNVPITYISPDKLFDNEFLANVCSNQNDDGNGYVPLTVTLQATGCTQTSCVATACIKVTH